jgi:hypothetical protein
MTLEEAGKVIWLGVHGHAEDVINWLKKESTDGEIVD